MSQLPDVLGNLSPVSRGLAGTMIASYLLQLIIPGMRSFFGLVAGKTIMMPWMVVTSGLIQDSLLTLLIAVPAVLFLSRPIEALHSQPGYVKLILISLFGAGGFTFFLVTTLYYIIAVASKNDNAGDILYDPICGFQGGLGALLVGIKQALPDNEITILSFFQFKAKDLPGLYIIVTVVVGILTNSTVRLVPFAVFASYVAWFYLRFVAYRADSFLRGDPSPDFRFASFFPAAAQPVVDQVANVCARVTKIDKFLEAEAQQVQQQSALLLGRGAPSKDNSEAARRRERGARALEERLGGGLKAVATERTASEALRAGLASVLDAAETGTTTSKDDNNAVNAS